MRQDLSAHKGRGERDPLSGGGRNRLLRPTTIVLLAVAVGSMLLLLFPEVDFSEPNLSGKPTELTTDYLRVLLRSKPDDKSLRLLLGQNQLKLGHLKGCRKTLQPLLHLKGSLGMQARVAYLEATSSLFHRLAKGDAAEEARAGAKAQLGRLLKDPLGGVELEKLTQISLELGFDRHTGELYDRLGAAKPSKRSNWYAIAARWYLAAGRYAEASRAYLRASTTAGSRGEALARGRQAIEAWVQGNRPDRALSVCRGLLARFPRNVVLLERAVELALANNEQGLALDLNGQLVKRFPRNRRYIER